MTADIRLACRQLVKNRGFAAAAVLTLGLGIGVNVTTFTWLRATIFAGLPVEAPDRVVLVWSVHGADGISRSRTSAPDYYDWRAATASFEALAALRPTSYNLLGPGDSPVRVSGMQTTASFFATLGILPSAGRVLSARDETPGAPRVAVLSHSFWIRQFAGDRDVLGREVLLDGHAHTVVGIASERFTLLPVDLWAPLTAGAAGDDRGRREVLVIGRLAPDVTVGQASRELGAVAAGLARDHPDTNTGWSVLLVSLADALAGSDAKVLYGLVTLAVAFVLLIGCVNVGNLLLARGLARREEVAVRTALGASRVRVVRQFLTESLVLAAIGGSFGLLVAVWLNDLLRSTVLGSIPFVDEVGIDAGALLFAATVSTASALVFGAVPAFAASALQPHDALKAGARTAGRSPRLRQVLVGGEVALATALLIVAGVIIRTGVSVLRDDPGFDARNVLTARLSLPETAYPSGERATRFYAEAIAALAARSNVVGASATSRLPLAGSASNPNRMVEIDGYAGIERPWAVDLVVTPSYFQTLRIPVVRGRAFSDRDTSGAPPVAIVSEAFAQRYLRSGDPVGRRLRLGSGASPWVDIVGVAADVRNDDLGAPPLPHLYLAHAQHPAREMSFLVRTPGTPTGAQSAIEEVVRALDPTLPVYELRTMEQVVAADTADIPLIIGIFSVLSSLALLLASLGIYGVVAYSVRQQAREIAIRLALGATRREVVSLAGRRTAVWVAAGLAVGLAAALAVSRAVAHAVDFIEGVDPTLAAASLGLLLVVATLATYLPARHATRVDPMVTLRAE